MFDTKKVADTYDQIALNFSATRGKLSPELVSLLPRLEKEATVLDLGCGNGVLLTAFDRRSHGEGGSIAYTGLDISQNLINEASRSHLEGQFAVAGITKTQTWKDLGQFDFIAALAVLHHLSGKADHLFVLSQIKKHLKPSGSILISNWRLLQPKFDRFRTSARHLSIPFHGGPSRDFYAFTDTEIHEIVRDLGFSQTKTVIAKDNLYLTAKK